MKKESSRRNSRCSSAADDHVARNGCHLSVIGHSVPSLHGSSSETVLQEAAGGCSLPPLSSNSPSSQQLVGAVPRTPESPASVRPPRRRRLPLRARAVRHPAEASSSSLPVCARTVCRILPTRRPWSHRLPSRPPRVRSLGSRSSPTFQAATRACEKYAPTTAPPEHVSAQEMRKLLAVSSCMRTHGVPSPSPARSTPLPASTRTLRKFALPCKRAARSVKPLVLARRASEQGRARRASGSLRP
jgi:hypothetical protein